MANTQAHYLFAIGKHVWYTGGMARPTDKRDPDQVPEGFRRLVKHQMHQLGFSLRHVAEETGLSPGYLCHVLQGERGLPPDNDTLLRMARVLGIDPPERLLVEANRVPPGAEMKEGVKILLSATTAKTAAEKERAVKKIQAFLLSRKPKGGPT